MTILIALGAFTCTLLLVQGAYVTLFGPSRKEAERLRERLQVWPTGPENPKKTDIVRQTIISNIPWLNDWLPRLFNLDWFTRLHRQAKSRIPLATYLFLSPLLAFAGLLPALLFRRGSLVALVLAVLGGALPFLYLNLQKKKRMAAFQRQLPDALDLIGRALRAGHAFLVGMKMVGDEFGEPIGPEFASASEEVSMGVAVPQALRNLAERVDCVDMKFFVIAVNIQRETGGNLAEIIDSLTRVIRARFQLNAKVSALSAEGKLSAYVLSGLPIAMGFLLHLSNPRYLQPLFTDPIGHRLLMVGFVLMTIGALIMKKMVTIRF